MKKQLANTERFANRIWHWLALFLGLFILPMRLAMAQPELTGDPRVDPIPSFQFQTNQKTVAIGLYFSGPYLVQLETVEIIPGPTRGRTTDPPLLSAELQDLTGNVLEKFYKWHPLWVFTFDNSGQDHVSILSEGRGYITFPFRSNIATMKLTDVMAKKELISVELISHFHTFCRDNRSDPDCTNSVNRVPKCDADGPYTVECAGKSTNVKLDGTKCFDLDKDVLSYIWSGGFVGGTITGATPTVQFSGFGGFNVNLIVNDDFGGSSGCSSAVAVVDTTPPTIQSVSAIPNVLWPPLHQMIPVKVNVVSSDICDPALTCRIISVSSNEPMNGLGDGDMAPDWEVTGEQTLNLRAERSGMGSGRIYTITVACTDTSGNSTTRATTVSVPRDLRK
jgi:hypothetical protein